MESAQTKMKTIACQWMRVDKANIVNCGELPTQLAKNGMHYCSFHFRLGKNFKPFEKATKRP
jgi:hypothetical protein